MTLLLRNFMLIVVLGVSNSSIPFAGEQFLGDKIIGVWRLENGLDLQIYRHEEYYFGKIVALNAFNGGQTMDVYNPDEKLRSRPLLGLVILEKLRYNEKFQTWEKGKMYAPHLGVTATLEVEEVMGNELRAVGYKFWFWHAEIWKRVL